MGALVGVRGALVDVVVAVEVHPALVARAAEVVDAEVRAEAVLALRVAVGDVEARGVAVAGEALVARADVRAGGVLAVRESVALVVAEHGVALVDVHVAVGVGVAGLAGADVGVRADVAAGAAHAGAVGGQLGALVVLGVAVVNVLAAAVRGLGDLRGANVVDVRLLGEALAEAVAGEAGVAAAVVRAGVVDASGVVVALVDAHDALVPVRAAGGAAPAHHAVAGEAERAAVVAGTAVGARGELAVVGVDAGDAVAGPAGVAGALERARGVGAEGLIVARLGQGDVLAVLGVGALVLVNLAVEAD